MEGGVPLSGRRAVGARPIRGKIAQISRGASTIFYDPSGRPPRRPGGGAASRALFAFVLYMAGEARASHNRLDKRRI